MNRLLLLFAFLLSFTVHAQNAFYGRTSGQLPFLEFGLGDDRLGGAKMTYLDTNILVKIVDSAGTDYKVQLSKYHTAYLAKQSFRQDTTTEKPYYLTASWRVWGDEKWDYISVSLPEKLPYRSQQTASAELVVDIFGATSNTNWITQLATVKEIKNVWQEQVEDDVFRIHIQLKHRQSWGYFIYYKGKALQIRIKRQPSSLKIKHLTIAVDAGHGGSNTGAEGNTSHIQEKEYTLKIATQLQQLLEKKGANVYMTRTSDTDLTMPERTLALRQQDPDLLISVHLNSSDNTAVKGVSTYYRYIGFRPLSQAILKRMMDLGLANYGNVGAFNFSLSGPTEYPNCLVEVAFLSNTEDEKKILDEGFRHKAAKQIYKGIKDWLKAID